MKMSEKTNYGNWVPEALMKSLWTLTAVLCAVTALLFIFIKTPSAGIIPNIENKASVPAFIHTPWMVMDAGLIYGIR